MDFTPEQMNKAKSAKSAEELIRVAKEAGVSMTEEQAARYFAELNNQGELSDNELAAIAGGGPKSEETPAAPTEYYYPECVGIKVILEDKPICPNAIGLLACGQCEGCCYVFIAEDKEEYFSCNGHNKRYEPK